MPPCTAFAYTQSSDCSPFPSTFSWAASCDEAQEEEGILAWPSEGSSCQAIVAPRSQKVATDAGAQASRKTVCLRPRVPVFVRRHSRLLCTPLVVPKPAPSQVHPDALVSGIPYAAPGGWHPDNQRQTNTHTMGRRMNNGPADERGERGLVLVPACLHQFAAESHSRIPAPRPNLASTGCAASVPSRLDSLCWAFAVSPKGDGSSSRRFEQTAVPLFHGGISVRFRGWLAAGSRAIGCVCLQK